ncbi:MAG: cytochrome c [Chitinophagaceae bacterium]
MPREMTYILNGALLCIALWIAIVVFRLVVTPYTGNAAGGDRLVQEAPVVNLPAILNKKGERLFLDNCGVCHSMAKDIDGPSLKGIRDRIKDSALLYEWIRNSPAVLQSGNAYFNQLFKKWNRTPMSTFPGLTDNEIEAILDYVDEARW